MDEEYEEADANPYTFLASLQEGQEMLKQLEDELVYLVNDFLALGEHMSEVTAAVMKYTIAKTEEAIQQLELEIKMFDQ